MRRSLGTILVVLMILAGGWQGTGAAPGEKTLIIAAAAIPPNMDPDRTASFEGWEVKWNCCESLLEYPIIEDPVGSGQRRTDVTKPEQGLLASSYKISPDGKKIRFTLRKGVKSFYGNELTTKDVKWSFERAKLPGQGLDNYHRGALDINNPITVIDRYSFEVNLTTPNRMFLITQALSTPGFPMLDSTEVKKHATSNDPWARQWLSTHTAGFGPYNVQSYVSGKEVDWVANPNYHRTPPQIRRVIMREVPSSATRTALLKNGSVDVAYELTPRERKALQGLPGVKIEARTGNEGLIFGLNNAVKPLDNPKVRQAIAYAVPVDAIIQTVFEGEKTVHLAPGYAPPYYSGALKPEQWPYKRDLEKAKALLKDAGVGPFKVRLAFDSARPTHEEAALLIRDSLKEIGVDLTLDKLSPAQYQEQYFSRKAETVLVQDSAWGADAQYWIELYFSAKPRGGADWVNYNNPQVDSIIDEIVPLNDVAKRAELGRQAHEILVRDAPWAFYILLGYYLPTRDNITGFVYNTTNLLRYYYLDKR